MCAGGERREKEEKKRESRRERKVRETQHAMQHKKKEPHVIYTCTGETEEIGRRQMRHEQR